MKKTLFLLFISIVVFHTSYSQSALAEIRPKIKAFLKDKKTVVGIAIQGSTTKDTLSINGNQHLPMQSVFKLHLAIAILDLVDKGKYSLNDTFQVTNSRIKSYQHLWSPLRKKYPNGGSIQLSEIIEYTVAWSDNLGCDLLLELLGGPKSLEKFMHDIGIEEIAIQCNELVMQSNWDNQYQNWTTALALNQLITSLFYNKNDLLKTKTHAFLLEVLKKTETGKHRIKAGLPKGTIVGHKTGTSAKSPQGVYGAINDIGFVFLEENQPYFISILVGNSKENFATNEKIIADISRIVWNHFSNNKQ